MICPGVLAQQSLLSAGLVSIRPEVKLSDGFTSSSSTSHTIPIPSGWSSGDLCVLAFALSASNTFAAGSSGLTGWTRLARVNTSGVTLTGEIWWKVLQAGDADPVYLSNSAGFLSVRRLLFTAGTYNPSSPIELALPTGSGTSTSPSVSSSSTSYAAGYWKQLNFLFRRGVTSNATVTAYPLPQNQGFTSTGTGSGCGVCASDHDGGNTPVGAWSLSAESGWRTPVVLITPNG